MTETVPLDLIASIAFLFFIAWCIQEGSAVLYWKWFEWKHRTGHNDNES